MIEENNISIVAISDIKLKETINALIKSSNSINPVKTLLLSSKEINLNKYESEIINLVYIDPINSLKEYSKFIIYDLHKYIETSHVLIVQWDGYIINKKKWDKSFFKYDYIGAPFIPRAEDKSYSRDQKGGFYTIGNGGFSLRSKKLLLAPSKYKLKDNKKVTNYHEDGFFCVFHRNLLESKGFVWAPFEISQKFSIESPISLKELRDLPLGFHGKKMLYIIRIITILKNINKLFLFNK